MQDEARTIERDDAEPVITATEYELATGETLKQTIDLTRWKRGISAVADFGTLENEVAEAEAVSSKVLGVIRDKVFPALAEKPGCGVWAVSETQIEQAQKDVLLNGLAEGCDGNVNVFDTLALQIVQIGVVAVSYRDREEAFAHRIYKRDIRISSSSDMVEETLRLLRKRSPADKDSDRPRKVSEMMRRGVMTLMERQVLADFSQAPWRIGHGHPLAYELLTGSGFHELIELSLPILRRLVLDHRKFVFVPSETRDLHIKTIGDALGPREYALVTDAQAYLDDIAGGGYRGEWGGELKERLDAFFKEAGPQVMTGVFRASALSPPQVFYAHRDFAHQAALIALADSVHLEHRGFPLLIEVADQMCRSYFGAASLEKPTIAAFASTGEPHRHLPERSTR